MNDFIGAVGSGPPREAGSSKPAHGASESRQEPSDLAERAEAFRALMTGSPLTAEQLALLARGGAGQDSAADDMRRRGLDSASMLAMQCAADLATPPPVEAPPAGAPPDMSIAELIDKHVRRSMASAEIGSGRAAEVRLELSDAVLPGTALSLRQTAGGWQLSARADNKQSLDKLNEFAPELIKRFAQASLGRLEISVESGGG